MPGTATLYRLGYTNPSSGGRLKGDEYFATNVSSGASPNYGFASVNVQSGTASNTVSRTYNATGGPADRPYVRVVATDTLNIDEWGNEWLDGTFYPVSAQWGASTFLRFSIRMPTSLAQTYKIFIFNAGSPQDGDDRFIITTQDWSGACVLNLQRGAGTYISTRDGSYGGAGVGWSYSETGMAIAATNTWYNVQVEIRWASAEGVGDGYLKCWVNNDTYASTPYTTTADIPLTYQTGDNNKFLTAFSYWQNMGGGSKTVDITDIRIGPTFDANWHASGS